METKTDELKAALDSANLKIVDIRPVEAYNGWQLQNEARGGHIAGAIDMDTLALEAPGWPKVSVYDGGWFEWSSDPSNPYETGLPPE